MSRLDFLNDLEAVIDERIGSGDGDSYTAALAAAGMRRVAQKVGEEGVELALAAVSGDAREITDEAADLVFHVLVLLRSSGLSIGDVVAALERRHRR